MSQLIKHTPRLWSRETDHGKFFMIWCPGCGHGHIFETPRWTFDGNIESPTFKPSLRIFIIHPNTQQDVTLCHFNVIAGKIQYDNDFEHAYKGQTIDLPEIPADYCF